MKSKILTLLAGISIFAACGASAVPTTITQNITASASSSGTSFTFNTFDATLGTLNAVDLFIVSSTIQGSFTLNKTGGGNATITSIKNTLNIQGASGSGLSNDDGNTFQSTALEFNRNPSGTIILFGNATNSNRLVTINGTSQSIISSSTQVTLGGDFLFSYYIGDGVSTFNYNVFNQLEYSNSGSTFANNTNNILTPTTLSLRYSYTTDPSPVPEPGQVAASLLLLGGIGAYVFIKRRKKSAPAAA
jgi:hypothetical protein